MGSIVVNYLMQPSVSGLERAGGRQALAVLLGWGHGRAFSWADIFWRKTSQGRVLVGVATLAMRAGRFPANVAGDGSGWALLAIGLCNLVVYPDLSSLYSRDLGAHVVEGSGIIVVASVGGGVVPLLTGFTADWPGLSNGALDSRRFVISSSQPLGCTRRRACGAGQNFAKIKPANDSGSSCAIFSSRYFSLRSHPPPSLRPLPGLRKATHTLSACSMWSSNIRRRAGRRRLAEIR